MRRMVLRRSLVEHFANQIAGQNGWKAKKFLPDAVEELKRYSWPGNIRELRNVVERLMLLADDVVGRSAVEMSLPLPCASRSTGAGAGGTLAERVENFERETVLSELKRHNYRMTDVARSLGLERSHLYKKCQHLGIDLRAVRQQDS